MQYSMLGQTGLIVSRLAFGAMTFTSGNQDIASIYKVDGTLAQAMVNQCLDAGVTLFDTADAYAGGESEIILGKTLQGKREQVVLATKVGFRSGTPLTQAGLSRRHILYSIEQSLKRLNTDWVDLYIAHREDPHTPLEETLFALNDVVRSGKARYIGFSNWSAWKVAAAMEIQKQNGWAPFTHGQMHYSLLGRDVERDTIPMMRQYGLGLTVWSPLASGFLSGKYTPQNLSDTENRISGFDLLPFDKTKGFELVEHMRGIAAKHNVSVAQIALAWLLSKPSVSSIHIGATKLHQLEDNLKAADVVLTPQEIETLDTLTPLSPVYPFWFNQMLVDQPLEEALSPKAGVLVAR